MLLIVAASLSAQNENPPMLGKILYVDSAAPDSHFLTSINPDGTGKTRMTPSFNNMMFPRYNEASGWIGFTNKAPDMTSEIYLLNRTGDRIKKVLTGAAIEDFSPDGKFFLYTSCDGKAELFVYSLDRKRANKISQDLKVTAANWSKNGEWIAVSVLTDDGTNDLYLISTLAQGIIRITDTKKVNETFPVFTNDDKYLVYFTDRYGSNELEYMDIETKQLQRPNVGGLFPALSPDNKHVTYQVGESIAVSRIDGMDINVLVPGRTPIWIK
ncbi:MAG: Protein tolB [uncultured bacterium]|nr:MAG: Protein tolB [uncultured bacterium]